MGTISNRTVRAAPSARLRTGGFTLVEVMVALGILAIALPMVASALVSGMLENQESVETTMSTMLADNAVAILRCRARDSDFKRNWGWGKARLTSKDERVPAYIIHPDDCVHRPFDKPTPFAFVILGQRLGIAAGVNDYRFVVMVYRKLGQTDDLQEARAEFKRDGTLHEDPNRTYVRLASTPANQSAMMSYCVVRMSLRP